MYCLNFREKIDLDISYESSTRTHLLFTWNVPHLIPKTATNFKSVVCFCGQLYYRVRLLQAQWKNMVFLHRPRLDRIHDKVICCGIYEAVCYPKRSLILCDLWHANIYFRRTDTAVYTETSHYTQEGVAFLWGWIFWIQSGLTMWLCDELQTIVVIGLLNRFVHGRVPTAVVISFLWWNIQTKRTRANLIKIGRKLHYKL